MRRIGSGFAVVVSLLFAGLSVQATIFSSVRGIVHDPQHRPVAGANPLLKSRASAFSLTAQSDQDGQFTFSAVPIGDYDVRSRPPDLKPRSNLPWQAFASTNVYYGSGFTNGMPDAQYPGNYLPQHTTFDLSFGKSFGEKYTVSLTGAKCGKSPRLA